MNLLDQYDFLAFDERTSSNIVRRDDGNYLAMIRLRGEWHRLCETTDPDEARHMYKCGRMMLYGEPWEIVCRLLERDEAVVAEHRQRRGSHG